MNSKRNDHMVFAAFASASTTSGGLGAWLHPSTDVGITEADYYINLARAVERGGFDMLFFDDRLAVPAAYGGTAAQAVRHGSRAVKLDLLTILGLVSSHTTHLGLGATYSTTYHGPYHVARAFATLDHLSGGRAVWNIVTSLNEQEAENFGVAYQNPEQRYDRADEFLEIVTGLWESWERDAVRADRSTGMFADPDKVHPLNYEGKFLSSRGPLSVPQPPQGWPVLLQAGQSGRGMEFAARWADLVFTAPASLEAARIQYGKQSAASDAAGRSAGRARVLPAIQIIVAETNEIAQARSDYFDTLALAEEELMMLSEQASFDFSKLAMDEPLPDDILDSVTGTRGVVKRFIDVAREGFGPGATLRQLAQSQMHHSVIRIVGDATRVADELQQWFESPACDGFAIVPADDPGTFEDFGRLVIPELRRRGLVPEQDRTRQTLRSRLGLPWRASR